MTEEQIERIVEHQTNALDKSFLTSGMSQAEYDQEIVALDKWASQQIRHDGEG